jgi:hypothetical protein
MWWPSFRSKKSELFDKTATGVQESQNHMILYLYSLLLRFRGITETVIPVQLHSLNVRVVEGHAGISVADLRLANAVEVVVRGKRFASFPQRLPNRQGLVVSCPTAVIHQ